MSKTDLQFVAQAENRRMESEDQERRIARLERMLAWVAKHSTHIATWPEELRDIENRK